VNISAVIIAFNEEKNIAQAIESVAWADEILVVDSESTDQTRQIAESLSAKVLLQHWLGFAGQKQFAVDNAANDWVFSLDADERVSDELKNEILQLKTLPENELADGYKIPRLSFYMNRPIRHSTWYPDWQLRFYNRRRGKWKDVLIHESVSLADDSKIKKLRGDILHFSMENAAHHNRKLTEIYAPLAAEQMYLQGKRTTPIKIVFAGFSAFFQNFILKRGFLDGFPGFCIARFASHYTFLKYLLLWELQQGFKVKSKK
jgi:glycosyltransferase involved in cell wall biosynthesis